MLALVYRKPRNNLERVLSLALQLLYSLVTFQIMRNPS
jgi:hypothetical protein